MTTIIQGDARAELARFPDGHFHCVVTSPPYWGLRDYGLEPLIWDGSPECEHEWGKWQEIHDEREAARVGKTRTTDRFYGDESRRFDGNHQKHTAGAFCRRCGAWKGSLGNEPTPELYVEHLVAVIREVRRVLRDDGVCWLNMGDSYASQGGFRDYGSSDGGTGCAFNSGLRGHGDGLKPKDLMMMPARVALALQADGWWLRAENIWAKKNPMPESCNDRTSRSHEFVYHLTKAERYFWDASAVREPHTDESAKRYLRGSSYTGDADATPYAMKNRPRGHGMPSQKWEGDGVSAPEWVKGHSGYIKADGTVMVNPAGRNLRSVWNLSTQPFGLEMCGSCKMIYTAAQYRRLRGGSMPRCEHEVADDEKCGGTKWLVQDGGAVCVACETFYTAKGLERLPRAAKCRRCGTEDAWLSHFATFPEKLVERCILAGSSEYGCCPECGKPWTRKVGKVGMVRIRSGSDTSGSAAIERAKGQHGNSSIFKTGEKPVSHTVGWRPGCTHDHKTVRCRTLDPFAGSGTVGAVAERLGRDSVLVELNPDYCELARHRTAQRGLTCAPQGASAPELAVESSEGEAP